jgi:hypothetical protein
MLDKQNDAEPQHGYACHWQIPARQRRAKARESQPGEQRTDHRNTDAARDASRRDGASGTNRSGYRADSRFRDFHTKTFFGRSANVLAFKIQPQVT